MVRAVELVGNSVKLPCAVEDRAEFSEGACRGAE